MTPRPGHGTGSTYTTPRACEVAHLIGPEHRREGVALTRDEARGLRRLYGYRVETPGADTREACAVAAYLQTGADRDMHRSAERDGLRVVAWLARHLAAGDDPLKIVVQLARDARWDVDPADVAWADGDADEPEDEATP